MFAFNAVMPIILLVALGYILKKYNVINEKFFDYGNKLGFVILLPLLLFKNIYDSDLSSIDWSIVVYPLIVIILLFIIGLLYVIFFIKDNKQKGVVLQCFYRSNYALIGIPMVTALFPAESVLNIQAIQVASVVSAFTIPLFNILAVISLSLFVHDDSKSGHFKSVLKGIITNPLIIGVFAGIIMNVLRTLLWPSIEVGDAAPSIYSAIQLLASCATPIALIVLGGRFKFSAVSKLKAQIIVGVVGRNFIVPILGIGGAILFFDFGPAELAALIALFATPTAVSSAIMAIEMHNDGELAGQYVVWTTLVSPFTIFAILYVLKALNYL